MSDEVVKVGVGVIVYKDGKVLMGRRKNAHGAGEYCGPGGHLEFGESVELAARRETLEEAGIEIDNLRFLCTTNFCRYGKHYINIGMVADWKSGEVGNLEPHKREGWAWYDIDDLPKPLFAVLPFYVEALKTGQRFFEAVEASDVVSRPVPTRKVLTLCIPHQGDRVLLAMKKRGFGAGRWNGFGGKVEAGETIEEAARRETREEGMIEVGQMRELGVVEFTWQNRPDLLEVHIFKATDFTGEPTETEEMRPQWFGVDEVPFDQMWSDDPYWFEYFLANRPFRAKFLFDDADQVLGQEVRGLAEV